MGACCFRAEGDHFESLLGQRDGHDDFNDTIRSMSVQPVTLPQFDEERLNTLLNRLVELNKEIFALYDAKNDGQITQEDYVFVMRTLAKVWRTPRADAQILSKYKYMDRERLGFIGFEEYIHPKMAFVRASYERDIKRHGKPNDDRERWEESEYCIRALITSSQLFLKTLKNIFPNGVSSVHPTRSMTTNSKIRSLNSPADGADPVSSHRAKTVY